jgi:hypothetical protein
MGWLSFLIGVVAAYLLYSEGSGALLTASLLLLALNFWTWGVMHNHATESARRRSSYTGGFADFIEADVDAVPNGVAIGNIVTSAGLLVLLIIALL